MKTGKDRQKMVLEYLTAARDRESPRSDVKERYDTLRVEFGEELKWLKKEDETLRIVALMGLAILAYAYFKLKPRENRRRSERASDLPFQGEAQPQSVPVPHVLCLILSEGELVSRFAAKTISENDWRELADSFTQRWYGEKKRYQETVEGFLREIQDPEPSLYSVRCVVIELPARDSQFDTFTTTRSAIRSFGLREPKYSVLPAISKAGLVGQMFD